MTAAAMHTHQVEEGCDVCGSTGYLLDQTYGNTEAADGWVPVQACDECRRFDDDERAAGEAARFESWGTACEVRWFGGGVDEDNGREFPGDWAIFVGLDVPQAVAS